MLNSKAVILSVAATAAAAAAAAATAAAYRYVSAIVFIKLTMNWLHKALMIKIKHEQCFIA